MVEKIVARGCASVLCVQCFGLGLSPLLDFTVVIMSIFFRLPRCDVASDYRVLVKKHYGMGTGQQKFSTFGLKTFSGIIFAPSDSLPTACNFGFLYFQTTLSSDILFNSLFEYTNALMTFLLAPA
jgi:hypothetical protein